MKPFVSPGKEIHTESIALLLHKITMEVYELVGVYIRSLRLRALLQVS